MLNSEAEDALLALGQALPWEWTDDNSVEFAVTPERHYQVGKRKYGWAFVSFARFRDCQASPLKKRFTEESPHTYREHAAAKAACECHHVTGKWEPGRQPMSQMVTEEALTEVDARSILLALGDPVAWNRFKDRTGELCEAVCYHPGSKRVAFCCTVVQAGEVRADDDGVPFRYFLEVGEWHYLPPKATEPDLATDEYTEIRKWRFPCYTRQAAQAVCTRLAVAGDTAELMRLDGGHYPLYWAPLRIDDNGPWVVEAEYAPLARNCQMIARYAIGLPVADALIEGGDAASVEALLDTGWGYVARYEVLAGGGISLDEHLRTFELRPPAEAPRRYTGEATAKAACERHHATGRWE